MANHTIYGNIAVGAPNSEARKQANIEHLTTANNMQAAMRTAFEFGYRTCEKGHNLQAALAIFDRHMDSQQCGE